MRIGELGKQTGFSTETIWYYEREGLLEAPERGENNYRRYAERHVDALLFIRSCRQLDMALDEIRTLLAFRNSPGDSCGTVNALLSEHLSHVQNRIRELVSLETELKTLQARCQQSRPIEECGVLKGLSGEPDRTSIPQVSSHVPGSHGR